MTHTLIFKRSKGEILGVFISQTHVKLIDKHDYIQVQHAEQR